MLKNILLNNFNFADKLYKFLRRFPKFITFFLIDIYFLIPQKNQSFPSRLTIFLTDKCNMKCSHCFIIKEIPKKTLEMSTDEYKKFFKSLKGRTSQILFTGGEPTLRKDFYEILESAYFDGKVSTVTIFSNGLYPEKIKELINKLIKNTNLKINFHTSIDGDKKFHNFNRRVDDSYERALESVNTVNKIKENFQNRLGRIVAHISISKMNLNSLSSIFQDLKAHNFHFGLGFTRAHDDVHNIDKKFVTTDLGVEKEKSDGSEKFGNSFLNYNEMKDAIKLLENNLWEKNKNELIYAFQKVSMQGRQKLEKEKTSPINIECQMGYEDLIVLANGKIARCEMLTPHTFLGDFDYNLESLIKSNIHKNHLKDTSGCYCAHECAISVTAMSDKKLIKQMFN